MTRSGLSMYLLQEHHAASKAGQAVKLNSQGLREWCYCFFLQLQALHFDTGLLFPQAEKYKLRQNWKKTQLPHHRVPAACGKWSHNPSRHGAQRLSSLPAGRHCWHSALLRASRTTHGPSQPSTSAHGTRHRLHQENRNPQGPSAAGRGGHHHKQEEFSFTFHHHRRHAWNHPCTGSLRRQLPCTSCKIYTL